MRTLTLLRLEDTGAATFGQLFEEEARRIACTLELPWRDNLPGVSCIPAGTYTARRRQSVKHHCELFGLEDVPDRTDIEIHIGNFSPRDTEGCILLGGSFGVVDAEHCILESKETFTRFMASMKAVDAFTLVVSDPAR